MRIESDHKNSRTALQFLNYSFGKKWGTIYGEGKVLDGVWDGYLGVLAS